MTECKKCGVQVVWVKRDRWYCENPDGTDHWDLCSKLRMEGFRANGEFFSAKRGNAKVKGYKLGHREQLVEIKSKAIVGKNYKPDGCSCGLPPWSLCKQECSHAIR